MRKNGFFDSMIIMSSGKQCRASDLYTKRDPFIKRPHSFQDLSPEEKEAQRIASQDEKLNESV